MLEEIVKNIIPNCELEITGLIFYPFNSGISYIFTEKAIGDKLPVNQNNTKIVSNDSYNMIHQIKEFLLNRTYSYETNGVKKQLMIESTSITDVYNLYEVDNNKDNKIGIAHIPNYKVSRYCNENIKEKVKCLCIFNKQFNKWIPLNIIS